MQFVKFSTAPCTEVHRDEKELNPHTESRHDVQMMPRFKEKKEKKKLWKKWLECDVSLSHTTLTERRDRCEENTDRNHL